MKKIIEFVYQPLNENVYSPHIKAIDINDISSYEQHGKIFCKLITKSASEFYIFGTYRVIGNRIHHTEIKTNRIYEDFIIRPSTSLMYKIDTLEVSDIIMDAPQLKAFVDAFYYQENLEKIYKEMIQHTYEKINELPAHFWKIN